MHSSLSPFIESSLSSGLFKGTQFSHRELQVMFYVVRGKTAKGIAKELTLSPRTVEHYMEQIKNKMNVDNKGKLIEKIIDHFILG